MERGFPFISFAIMVQNEEKTIKPLLEQLTDFQNQFHNAEIMVVDGGSDDKTLEILSKYVPEGNIYKRTFNGDFADQRNFLTSLCNGEWIFHIDADELMPRELYNKLNDILTSAAVGGIEVLFVPRVNTITNMTLEDKDRFESMGWKVDAERHVNFPDYQSRIQRKNSMIVWEGKVHETLNGFQKYYHIPAEKSISLIHAKTKERQFEQLNRYDKIGK